MGETAETVLCSRCGAGLPSTSKYCSKCGQAVSDAAATLTIPGSLEARLKEELYFAPGASFGPRYRIIEEIGRGGMGRVYKAEDLELGTVVALKMIRPEYSSSRTMIAHFKKETLLARSVSHENVVRTHDLGEVGPVRYISMDYIKGGNLEDLIRTSGRLSPETALRLIEQVGEALAAAHGKGIIHQDLKPQNILVDHSGRAYLTDFGLARTLSGPALETSGKIYGTPRYFAPEQARGGKADERADIYAVGVILYEMLTGKLPFRASTIEGYAEKHVSEVPVPPSKLQPGIPPALDRIVLKCLEKRKEDRYRSAGALLEDLRASRTAGGPAVPRSRRARRLRAGLIAVAALGLALGGIWLGLKKKPVPPAAENARMAVAVLYSVNMSEDRSLGHLRWEIADLMIAGLAQSRYLSLLPLDRLLQALTKMGQLDAAQHVSGTLDKIGEAENIDYFILPSFVRAGDKLWISAKIRKAKSPGILDSAQVEGRSEDLVALVQKLNGDIRTKLIPVPEDAMEAYRRDLGKIATPSLDALAAYVEGERLYALADYSGSIRALEKAVASDPGYAMAYWRLAENHMYLGNADQAGAYIKRSLALSDRVSVRDRYLIEGFAALSLEGAPLKAVESYKKLLSLYPNNETGLSYLGSIYRNMEEWDAAIEQYERLRKLNPRYQSAYENLAFVYTAKGWYDKALDLLRDAKPVFPEVRFFAYQSNLIYIILGRFEEAAAGIEISLSGRPDDRDALELRAILAHLREDPASARNAYEAVRKSEAGTGDTRGRMGLAQIALLRGRYADSRAELRRAVDEVRAAKRGYDEMEILWELGSLALRQGRFSEAAAAADGIAAAGQAAGRSYNSKSALLLKGLADVGTGKLEAAQAVLADLRRGVERTGMPNHMRYVLLLEGRIALAAGRPAAAVASLELALALLPRQRERFDEHALFLDALAEARERAGDPEKAEDAYRAILGLTTGRLRWGDIFVLAHFRLGRLLQAKAAASEAVAHLEAFLDAWADADPGRPEVVEAKEMIGRLRKLPGS